MLAAMTEEGVTSRAIKSGQVQLYCWNPRDYTRDRHRTVDDRPYGGGPGMVMKLEPLGDAISAAKKAGGASAETRVICLSPQGRRLDQVGVRRLAEYPRLILVSGRYEGVDERVIDAFVDEEWSIGDYVLSGGELAAMVVVDAITRTLPGVLGHPDSAQQDSFMDGLLDHPHYTRPKESAVGRVPEVLLSGDHEAIHRWRRQQALGRTWLRRRDLLAKLSLNSEEQNLLEEYQEELQAKDSS